MRRLIVPLALFALCWTAAGVQAQGYKIDIKEFPDKGKTVSTKHTTKTKTATKISVGGMVVQQKTINDEKTIVYDMVVLEEGRRKPKKYKKTYSKALSSKNNQESKLSYHMRTVIFDLKNGKYTVEAEGQPPLDGKELLNLQKQANGALQHNWSSILIPDKKIAVGESWKVPPKDLAKGLASGLAIDAAKSSASGKLRKVYDKGASKFGVIQFDVKLAVSKLGPQKLDNPAVFTLDVTTDTAIDGTSTAGTMNVDGTLVARINVQQGGQAFTVDISSHVQDEQVQTAEK